METNVKQYSTVLYHDILSSNHIETLPFMPVPVYRLIMNYIRSPLRVKLVLTYLMHFNCATCTRVANNMSSYGLKAIKWFSLILLLLKLSVSIIKQSYDQGFSSCGHSSFILETTTKSA